MEKEFASLLASFAIQSIRWARYPHKNGAFSNGPRSNVEECFMAYQQCGWPGKTTFDEKNIRNYLQIVLHLFSSFRLKSCGKTQKMSVGGKKWHTGGCYCIDHKLDSSDWKYLKAKLLWQIQVICLTAHTKEDA